jgi:tetraacyldisaccharide 4'-kinase
VSANIADLRGVRRRATRRGGWALGASWLYGFGARLRKGMYDGGLLRTRRVSLPVVSVGALSAGGSGKTPFVRWLARSLRDRGIPVAILSRGYGSRGGNAPRIVDPSRPDAARDGDEPALLARTLEGVPIVVCPDRAHGAAVARGRGARLLLLDDGFQHRKLHRDLDVVLWDRASEASGGRVLPAGCLREPLSALRRADIGVLVDRGDGAPDPPRGEGLVTMNARLLSGARQPIPEGTRVHALSGIADPESFERGLAELGLVVTGATRHADHHAWRGEDVRAAAARAEAEGADVLAVTAKDWMRWPGRRSDLPVPAVFDLDVEVDGGETLVARIAALVREGDAS